MGEIGLKFLEKILGNFIQININNFEIQKKGQFMKVAKVS
jgi:hypothetical protein